MCNCWVCLGEGALELLKISATPDQQKYIVRLEQYHREVEDKMTNMGMDLYHTTEALKELEKPLRQVVKEHNNIMRRIKFMEKDKERS